MSLHDNRASARPDLLSGTPNLTQIIVRQEQLGQQEQPMQFQGSASSIQVNACVDSILGQHHPPSYGCLLPQNSLHFTQVNQQHLHQNATREMINNNKRRSQQTTNTPSTNGSVAAEVIGCGIQVRMNPGSVGNGAKFSNMHTGMAASSIVTVLTRVELIQNAVLAEVNLIAEGFEHGVPW